MDDSIRSRGRVGQITDFEGMSTHGIGATDVDALIEYKDKGYVIVEVKYKDTSVPLGQRIALERMAKDLSITGKEVLIVVCEHSVRDFKKDIILKDCKVRCIYKTGEFKWRKTKDKLRLRELIIKFLDTIDLQEE